MKPFHFVHIFFIFGASFPFQSLMIQIQPPLSLPNSTNIFPVIYIFQLFICLILLRLYVPPEPYFCLPDTRSSAESPEIPHFFFFSACPDFFSCSECKRPLFAAHPLFAIFPRRQYIQKQPPVPKEPAARGIYARIRAVASSSYCRVYSS